MIGGQLGYARLLDGIVYISGYEDNRYQTVRTDRDEEGEYFPIDLTPWKPLAGELVTEIDNEDSPVGIVVEAGEEISQVKWGGLLRLASWGNSCLEPAWTD